LSHKKAADVPLFLLYSESVYIEGLKKTLDEVFSKFTRLTYADWKGDVSCFTCSWRGHWTECDAGHFVSRGCLILRFEPDNVRPQCRDCNRHAEGKRAVFEEELRGELGDERVDEILRLRRQSAFYEPDWFRDRIIHYESLVKRLLSGDNVRA
jgi:hypothetical protein